MMMELHWENVGDLANVTQLPELNVVGQLEDALRKSYVLVDSCQNRSYRYLLAMGWTIINLFRQAHAEIGRYTKIVPLINLLDNHRVKVVSSGPIW